jgi:hypothetical protein
VHALSVVVADFWRVGFYFAAVLGVLFDAKLEAGMKSSLFGAECGVRNWGTAARVVVLLGANLKAGTKSSLFEADFGVWNCDSA